MKIPFTLDAWLKDKSQKVETRSGKNVRIICWDKIGVPIVALVGDADDIVTYNRDGTTGQQMQLPSDLFIVTPEQELTEFEIALENFVMNADASEQTFHEDVKQNAAELLALARKELVDDVQLQFDDEINEAYYRGRKEGKAEALKDLPRWRKWGNGACGNGRGIPLAIVKRGLNGYELVDALGIQGEQYIMLSDLEKLTGFND